MSKEENKSLRDEEADSLLQEVASSSVRDFIYRRKYHMTWLRFAAAGSVLLNLVLAICLLRDKFELQTQQKSPYSG